MLTPLRKATAQAIVNIFETGRARGDYGQVTLLAGDAGHLTYGRSQTTLASGNLHLLIKAYCEEAQAQLAVELSVFLERLASRDLTLDHDMALRNLLREAGSDAIMHQVQDQFFDRVYWTPAEREAQGLTIASGLGTNVVYDSFVHGSWRLMRDRTVERHGTLIAIGEKNWVASYVAVRKDWLENHTNPLLRRTIYRMSSFQQLIQDDNWDLNLPMNVRGVRLDEELLSEPAPIRVSAEENRDRTLLLRVPHMVGDDVLEVQSALAKKGIPMDQDGIYGPLTEAAVRRFQQQAGLRADGIVGPGTRAALGL